MGLMFSFGSNLHLGQMAKRCPDAVPLGRLKLPGWRLVFRGVADVVPQDGYVCWGGVWRITPRCERALDVYEGVSGGFYRKEYIALSKAPPGDDKEMLVYTMNSEGIFPPSEGYLQTIEQGYRDFRMPKVAYKALEDAVRQAWDDKRPSYRERQRHRRNGRPRLAQHPGSDGDRNKNNAVVNLETNPCVS